VTLKTHMKVIIHDITVLTNINSFGEHKRQKQKKKKIGLKTLEQSSSGTSETFRKV